MAAALTTPQALLDRIYGYDSGDIKELLQRCLESASVQLAAMIQSESFDRVAAAKDLFVIRDADLSFMGRIMDLRLRRGFVDEDTTPVVIRCGGTMDLSAEDPLPTGVYRVDKEAGFVSIDWLALTDVTGCRRLTDQVIEVTYDAGLNTKTGDIGKEYIGVPDWLKEAALIKGREIYQLTNPAKDKVATDVSVNLHQLIEPHLRAKPHYLIPE